MRIATIAVCIRACLAWLAWLDGSAVADVAVRAPTANAVEPLTLSARYLPKRAKHSFAIRLTNHSDKPMKLLFRKKPDETGFSSSPFFFRFDVDPSQTMEARIMGPRIRAVGPGRSIDFVVVVAIVGGEYEPRLIYDTTNKEGDCPACPELRVESPIIADWPPEPPPPAY